MAKLALGQVIPGFQVGTTTTGEAGTQAAVTLTGTLTDKTFQFTIPQGKKGDIGANGNVGPQGKTGDTGKQGDVGPIGPIGLTGADGKSAYRVAVDIGFEGTIQEWIASLTGADGPQGIQGIQGETGGIGPEGKQGIQGIRGEAGKGLDIRGYFDTESELKITDPDHNYMYGVGLLAPFDIWDWDSINNKWVNNGKLQGADGKSAYQVAVSDGFVGTEAEWISSLKGATGVQGKDGLAASIAIGAVTTGEAGTTASVSNTGTSSAAVFAFTIPRGDTGAKGSDGLDGATGEKGADGRQGVDGAPGKSAYTAATEHGFAGTEAVFGESMAELPAHLDDEARHVTAEKQTAWSAKATPEQAQGYVDTHNLALSPHPNVKWVRYTDAEAAEPVPVNADTLQGASLNDIKALIAVKADKSRSLLFTLTASGWTGADVPYQQTVNVAGIMAASNGVADIAKNATDAQWTAYQDGAIRSSGQADGTLTFKATGDKPTTDIPMEIVLWG